MLYLKLNKKISLTSDLCDASGHTFQPTAYFVLKEDLKKPHFLLTKDFQVFCHLDIPSLAYLCFIAMKDALMGAPNTRRCSQEDSMDHQRNICREALHEQMQCLHHQQSTTHTATYGRSPCLQNGYQQKANCTHWM